jgi:hypothetical protein
MSMLKPFSYSHSRPQQSIMPRLPSSELDKVWKKFNVMNSLDVAPYAYATSYQNVTRRYGLGAKFEAWLYEEYGARVVQQDRQRYLEFSFHEQAMWFALQQ